MISSRDGVNKMKFNIGDLVYIRNHTYDEKKIYSKNFGIRWVSEMEEFEGRVGRIRHHNLWFNEEQYLVNYDGEEFWFSVDSLKAYEPTFKIGTRVLIRHHSNEEKLHYRSQHMLSWEKSMEKGEGHTGVIVQCDTNDYLNPIYGVSNGTYYWWFAESSLTSLPYDVF